MLSEKFMPSTTALYTNCKPAALIQGKLKDENYLLHFENEDNTAANPAKKFPAATNNIATTTTTTATTKTKTAFNIQTTTTTNSSMTKQLTTTTSATAITTAAKIAPTALSPTATSTVAVTVTTTTTTTTSATTISQCPKQPLQHSPTTTAASAILTTETTNLNLNNGNNNNTNATIATTQALVTPIAATTIAAATTLNTIQATLKPAGAATRASHDSSGGRSSALERAYVHDVYEHCEEPTGPIRPRVAQFLSSLDPGSVVCDVGCGSGRYLTGCNPQICTIGVDRCLRLSNEARERGGEVALCDNLELPFRDESFDAVISLAVVHHFATTERRVNALRELARILRIGGRVVITVWALEQRNRRFESQDVLIPWQPPKNRNFNCSDEEEDDDFLPPYHAYTEDSTNSSRSAGDGDSSSLSSSSPGESCYSFVRRAIQKLASGRKHAWFLDSWNSKDTKNDSSLDYEDARDLPIELRRLEDFEDFVDPPLSAGLKSRSLGSILNPPPRQIVRSRSSVPSLGAPLLHSEKLQPNSSQLLSVTDAQTSNAGANGHSPTHYATNGGPATSASGTSSLGRRPKLIKQKQSLCDEDYQLPENPFHMISSYNSSSNSVTNSLYTKSSYYHSTAGGQYQTQHQQAQFSARQMAQASVLLRKQSSLNEELMAANRIREKDRVRKRIQKQMSLNEAFLCRSAMFSKRLQVIREGVATRIKSSTGSLERVTKNGLTKIMQNIKAAQSTTHAAGTGATSSNPQGQPAQQTQGHGTQHGRCPQHQHYHHHHHHHHYQQQLQASSGGGLNSPFPTHILHMQTSLGNTAGKFAGPVTYCNDYDCASTACCCSTYHHGCSNCGSKRSSVSSHEDNNPDDKARRHSRESGSDSSKDSSLQSDTSIESEDSFVSVIFIPKPEQHQQQLNYQQQHQNSNSSSSNSTSSNGGHPLKCPDCSNCCGPPANACGTQRSNSWVVSTTGTAQQQQLQYQRDNHQHRVPSLPTSPLIMPCPPTPAHSPAAAQAQVTSPPQSVAAVTAAMAILTPPPKANSTLESGDATAESGKSTRMNGVLPKSRFTFDEAHIKRQQETQKEQENFKKEKETKEKETKPSINFKVTPTTKQSSTAANRITRQTIKDLPPIPKFRKQQSLQLHRQTFPIVRRSSAASGVAVPSIPKLLSLELFNPATDDLDSDSSEPSSPDSIDSVISAPRSAAITASASEDHTKDKDSIDIPDIENEDDLEIERSIKLKQQQYHNGDLKINPAAPNDIILNDDSANLLPKSKNTNPFVGKQQDCAEFAEKLSAQLLREIEDKNNAAECRSLEGIGDIGEYLDDLSGSIGSGSGGSKKRNGETRDLTALREELRERRLMLANLSTQPSLQQSPASSSTSSLSSQTRSFTIHEEGEDEDEEENERSYTLQLFENCKISKFNYKRNRQYNLSPETAYLLQDDGDSSIRDDDDEDDIEHDVIIEEDEEEETEANGGDQLGESMHDHLSRRQARNTIKSNSLEENSLPSSSSEQKSSTTHDHKNHPSVIQNRHSTESWEHSNSSTTSLDSPSQGGATTHHRYYHVFREGELDALINHHVASLHIVSSYYERASWCVIAEKVQVWTI